MKLLLMPQFYEIFGIFAFAYITILSIWQLNSFSSISYWFYYALLAIGIAGLIIDVAMVYRKFLR